MLSKMLKEASTESALSKMLEKVCTCGDLEEEKKSAKKIHDLFCDCESKSRKRNYVIWSICVWRMTEKTCFVIFLPRPLSKSLATKKFEARNSHRILEQEISQGSGAKKSRSEKKSSNDAGIGKKS